MNVQQPLPNQLQELTDKTLLIKIGGSILQDEASVQSFCEDILSLAEFGCRLVLVHGGGKAITEALQLHGLSSEFIDGLRVTSPAAMKIIEMVLCGHVNQMLTRKLNNLGLDAVGISGASQRLFVAESHSRQHQCVGKITSVTSNIVSHLLSGQGANSAVIPVIASIGTDNMGQALNINADAAACRLAEALKVDQLIYLTDQDGIYDQQGQSYGQLTEWQLQDLIHRSVVVGGMLIKAKSILDSLKAGLNRIMILNGNRQQVLVNALCKGLLNGTVCEKTA